MRVIVRVQAFGIGHSFPNHRIVKKRASLLFALPLCFVDGKR